MIYKPPPININNLDSEKMKERFRMAIKQILKDDPELLSEIVYELRNKKLKKLNERFTENDGNSSE
jgi:hypothetical protein